MNEFKIKSLSETSMDDLIDTLEWYNRLRNEGGGFPLCLISAIQDELALRDPETYGCDLRRATISSNRRHDWNLEGF